MLHTDTRETTECGEREAAAATTTAPAVPAAPAAGHELFFQRCLWCGTPAYRRSFCRACGSTAFRRECSAGAGAVVRRTGHAPHHTWFVAMDEGFNLLCQVTGTSPVVVGIGARVRVVRTDTSVGQGLPVVELTHPAISSERWW
ncbi:Zn-ribbon domain-containing OB-fold protein [Streptomyces afghaniensis]|uniref:Zn-ribbon domain-containing OB-fold protein n=1 Tax=Streptomyces afghaniensis TaxID=66865 RepID=UPI00379C93AD